MKNKLKGFLLSAVLCFSMIIPDMNASAAQTIYDNKTGSQDGYDYELWKDYGTTSMTLNNGGTFSCQWSNIGNALFRKGMKFDSTKTYQQLGNITVDYSCNYQPSGNSYLCVYGWTKSPLVEYYVVDSWGTWRPPGATSKGQITVDGGTYDVYETTRVNQPSIEGNTTFKQFWSVRTSKRTSGTISVAEHFKAWENYGMKLGKLYEVALTVEGYQSSGSANVTKNDITVGGTSSSTGSTTNNNTNTNAGNTSSQSGQTKVECESMTLSGQYAGKINSPFSGVALYANNDLCKYTQYFAYGTHNVSIRACSNNSSTAKVDLKIGGQTKGTFQITGTTPQVYTLYNVNHGTGNQQIELVVTADTNQWDAYVDYITYGSGTNTSSNTTNNNTANTNTTNTTTNTTTNSWNAWDPWSNWSNWNSGNIWGSWYNWNMWGSQNTWDYWYNWNNQNTNNNTNNSTTNNTTSNNTTNNGSNNSTITASTKMVALTFDDGPSANTTSQVLDVLDKYDVPATFFLIGNQVNNNTKSIMQRQLSLGCELANHSYSHNYMNSLSASQVKNEINQTSQAIKNMVGVDVKFFRPPYLSTSNTMYQAIDLNFIQGITCNDWESYVSATDRANTILNSATDGSIILLHDFEGNSNTVAALPSIIEGLKAKGYTFVTVSQLFEYKGVNPSVEYKIWSNVKQ